MHDRTFSGRLAIAAIAAFVVIVLGAILPWPTAPPVSSADIPKDRTAIDAQPAIPQTLAGRRAQVDSTYRTLRGPLPPAPSGNGFEVIYGADNRKDIYAVTDLDAIAVAHAVCAVVDRSEITDNGDGTYTLATVPWTTQSGLPLCAGERFVGQLQLGFCTGFLVGPDLLATAGHCVSAADCAATAFVFGFEQIDSTTAPATVVSADNVYFCSGVVNRVLSGDYDHCILQLDRPVVGRDPLTIRRTGSVTNGDPLVVVGHGIVLPTKAADGANVQNDNGAIPWFQANLDTYGGNSGSPVVNTDTWTVEGILVRGAPDFVNGGGCMRSNVVPNSGNPGTGLPFEEVSKTITFAASVPPLISSRGTIKLDRTYYRCSDSAKLELADLDLTGAGSHSIVVATSTGDTEIVALTETSPASGAFLGVVVLATGASLLGNDTIEVVHTNTLTAVYSDADDGTGNPATAVDSAVIDCQPPAITNVTVPVVGGTSATVAFDTDEPAASAAHYGTACTQLLQSRTGPGGTTSHQLALTGLTPQTPYFFAVGATDRAGNVAADDNGGACFTFATTSQPDYFTELFDNSDDDLDNKTITFRPDGTNDFYAACTEPALAFPIDPAGGTTLSLGDDAFVAVDLADGAHVSLYGVAYTKLYVGSNGYITFGSGDNDYTESFADHFGRPRISALFDDLAPNQGGTVSYRQLTDRMAVTFAGIPEYGTGDANDFQIAMFFDGRIAVTYLAIAATDGLAGLSAGSGLPPDFMESDLSAYGPCACPDTDADGVCDSVDNCPYFANPGQVGCPFHGDPKPDGVLNVYDVVLTVDVAFRNGGAIIDSTCPHAPAGRTDVDCNGLTNVIDLVRIIDVAFRGAPRNFCNPCACHPYPTGCP